MRLNTQGTYIDTLSFIHDSTPRVLDPYLRDVVLAELNDTSRIENKVDLAGKIHAIDQTILAGLPDEIDLQPFKRQLSQILGSSQLRLSEDIFRYAVAVQSIEGLTLPEMGLVGDVDRLISYLTNSASELAPGMDNILILAMHMRILNISGDIGELLPTKYYDYTLESIANPSVIAKEYEQLKYLTIVRILWPQRLEQIRSQVPPVLDIFKGHLSHKDKSFIKVVDTVYYLSIIQAAELLFTDTGIEIIPETVGNSHGHPLLSDQLYFSNEV